MTDFARKELTKKLNIFLVIVVIIFVSLLVKLFFLQIVSAEDYKVMSDGNRMRVMEKEPMRGDIKDAEGNSLATSKPFFSISISSLGQEGQDEVIEEMVRLLDMPEVTIETVNEKISEHYRAYEPVEIAKLPWNPETLEIITRIEEKRKELPGVVIQKVPVRHYPYGSTAGHVLGYIGAINQDELDRLEHYGYTMHDAIGKRGIERTVEFRELESETIGLRGDKGITQVEVNAYNRPIKTIMELPPTPGDNVELTLDLNLQKTMETALDEIIEEAKRENPKAGAAGAVVLDVNSGAVLALSSKPDLNPNDFVDGQYQEKLDYYQQSPGPWTNRVVQEEYPPGSAIKMIPGMAALEYTGIDPKHSVNCTGRYWEPPYMRCHSVHGRISFERGLAASCNVYFLYLGERTGIDNIVKIGEKFGLGEKTGARDIELEKSGLLATPDWKREMGSISTDRLYERKKDELAKEFAELIEKAESEEEKSQLESRLQIEKRLLEAQYNIDYRFNTNWHPYDTYNTSIGQGYNQFTVLQLANYVAAIASKGERWKPYLVDRIVSADGKALKDYEPELSRRIELSDDTFDEIIRGMKGVTSPGGTAYSIFRDFPEEIKVAAKTGTSQTGRRGDDPDGDYHGVFVAFAPADDPEIAFAGVVEYGGAGGTTAGRVAKAVFEAYFGIER